MYPSPLPDLSRCRDLNGAGCSIMNECKYALAEDSTKELSHDQSTLEL